MDKYKNQVIECFGNTEPYKEYMCKTANYTEADFADSSEGLNRILKKFAQCKAEGNTPDSDKTQTLVKELQSFITNNFYTCTDEILKGLGAMYVADGRFKENIDKNGPGTADFISSAMEIYCK